MQSIKATFEVFIVKDFQTLWVGKDGYYDNIYFFLNCHNLNKEKFGISIKIVLSFRNSTEP